MATFWQQLGDTALYGINRRIDAEFDAPQTVTPPEPVRQSREVDATVATGVPVQSGLLGVPMQTWVIVGTVAAGLGLVILLLRR